MNLDGLNTKMYYLAKSVDYYYVPYYVIYGLLTVRG